MDVGTASKLTFQASFQLWEQKNICWVMSGMCGGCGQVDGHSERGVGWSVVVIELPEIGSLRSFPFDCSVQVRKDFFVENCIESSSRKYKFPLLRKTRQTLRRLSIFHHIHF